VNRSDAERWRALPTCFVTPAQAGAQITSTQEVHTEMEGAEFRDVFLSNQALDRRCTGSRPPPGDGESDWPHASGQTTSGSPIVARLLKPRHDYGRRDYDGDLRKGPSGARAARDALDRLEAAGWRDLSADAFGVSWNDQVLALVLQDGLPRLVFSGSNFADENHVFALWDSEPIRYFGECLRRFDCRLPDTPPLRFQVEA
jgi:hypothetical protein